MSFNAQILADSFYVTPDGTASRLTTFSVTYPRFILAEVNTHRMLSRNTASSRAIPVKRRITEMENDPFEFVEWGANKRGMQAGEEVEAEAIAAAKDIWASARKAAMTAAGCMSDLNVHKQIANRLLEPFIWNTTIISGTDWDNFFALRTHKDAQPEFQVIARMMKEVHDSSTPDYVIPNDWHLPMLTWNDRVSGLSIEDQVKVSAGKCGRVSYLTHDGKRDHSADIDLHDRMLSSGHMSALEHPARPMTVSEWDAIDAIRREIRSFKTDDPNVIRMLAQMELQVTYSGNYRGWIPYRKTIPGESIFRG